MPTTPSTDLLHTYLRDHRAASIAGLRVARRASRANRDGVFGPRLRTLADELATDLAVLDEIMGVLGVSKSRIKHAGAVLGETVSRLKWNHRLVGYSPLSRVLELEGLAGGIEGKASLWAALSATGHPALAAFDLDELRARAGSQQREVHDLHARAAEMAFGQDRRDSSSGRSSSSQNERNPS